ncbi:3928_t:CDS:2, partial [Scutellospora calospora]
TETYIKKKRKLDQDKNKINTVNNDKKNWYLSLDQQELVKQGKANLKSKSPFSAPISRKPTKDKQEAKLKSNPRNETGTLPLDQLNSKSPFPTSISRKPTRISQIRINQIENNSEKKNQTRIYRCVPGKFESLFLKVQIPIP